MMNKEITDAQIDALWKTMDGDKNWLLTFGYQQFARAVLAMKAPAPESQPGIADLPNLPEPRVSNGVFDYYSGQQMLEYGLACLAAFPAPAAPVPAPSEGVPSLADRAANCIRTGINYAASHIEKQAADYLRQNASTEPDTGATVFQYGEAGRDYHSTLVELAEEIRALAAPAAPATSDKAEEL